ncbi:MAG: radical SAM protein [Candidatus Omnitrophica bacterium]|nr:radical SAM protein [Candidatus Omnitrophota bacterium]
MNSKSLRSGNRLILLYYPKLYPSKEGACYFLQSLLSISGPLLKEGYRVKIVDGLFDPDPIKTLSEQMEEALCLGISSKTGFQLKDAISTARILKEKFPDKMIVFGGYHGSIMPETLFKAEVADVVVRGQGQQTFLELVNCLNAKDSFENLKGISFLNQRGKIVHNEDRGFIDINEFPSYPFELVPNIENYILPSININAKRSLVYVSTLGCPHRCAFCNDPAVFGRNWSGFSSEKVLADLEKLIKTYDLDGINMFDANTFVSKKRVEDICKGILSKGLKFNWMAEVRAQYIRGYDDNFLELLRESGCKQLMIGAESGVQEVLDFLDKDSKVGDLPFAIERLSKNNISVLLSFITSLPFMKKESFFDTVRMVLDLNKKYPSGLFVNFFHYLPFPGTVLYNRAKKLNYIFSDKLEDLFFHDFNDFEMFLKFPWVNKKDLDITNAVIGFYLPICLGTTGIGYYLTMKRKNKVVNFVFELTYKLLLHLANWRLRTNNFNFLIEWRIFNFIYKLRHKRRMY